MNNSMRFVFFSDLIPIGKTIFWFVLVEVLLVCSFVFIDTAMVLQVHLKEMFFDLGAKGGGISEVYYLVSRPISQFWKVFEKIMYFA